MVGVSFANGVAPLHAHTYLTVASASLGFVHFYTININTGATALASSHCPHSLP